MLGLDSSNIKNVCNKSHSFDGEIFVDIGVIGDIVGDAYFGFSKELAFKIFEIMTFCQPQEIDDIVCSAIAEISNITSGNVTTNLSTKGILCDITPPSVSLNKPNFCNDLNISTIDTGIGLLSIAVITK